MDPGLRRDDKRDRDDRREGYGEREGDDRREGLVSSWCRRVTSRDGRVGLREWL
jgi:hypothetical protein